MAAPEDSGLAASNELVRWLRLLALPAWARATILLVVIVVVLGGTALLLGSAFNRDAEQASSAIALLTVSMPVLLLVVALVFGQNSDRRLRQLTRDVLERDVPRAIRDNLGITGADEPEVRLRGCCADYRVRVPGADPSGVLRFSLELNVFKINVCFWLDGVSLPPKASVDCTELSPFRHVFLGAVAEGYRMNEEPAHFADQNQGAGLLFFRTLSQDFLVHPEQRLYFVQDLSFFVRGVIEAQRRAAHSQ